MLRKIRGCVFDMDGTLTAPHSINFARLRQRAGVPPGIDILDHISSLPSPARALAEAVVVEEEAAGLARTRLRPDSGTLLAALAARGLRRGLLTRNNDAAMAHTVAMIHAEATARGLRGETFCTMLSRSFEPPKPSAAPLLHICAQWGVKPSEVIFVGDSSDDMLCARSGGSVAVLIGDDEEAKPHADHMVEELSEVLGLIALYEGGGGEVA